MNKNLRVLMLEDNPADVELILHQLRTCGFEPDPILAVSESDYLDGLGQQPDIILADYSLPQFDALQALKLLKKAQLDIPYIVISGNIGEEKSVEVIREGATDYLLKDRLMRLGSAIERALSEKELRLQKQQAERELQDLNNQFQTLLNGISDSLMLLGPDLKVVWANNGAEKLASERNIDIEIAHCYDYCAGWTVLCDNCPSKRTFLSGESTEATIRTTEGRSFAIKVFPLKDEAGDVVNVIQWATDITEKTHLQLEAERSSRLASLGELSAGIAHEINNPNGIILLNSAVVRDTFLDILPILNEHFHTRSDLQLGGLPYNEISNELPFLISEIEDSAQRIKSIVDSLKDFVRGDDMESLDSVDLKYVAQIAVRLTENNLKKATNHLIIDYADQRLGVRGHQQQLVQVIVNLLTNACQALPDRGKSIRIATAVSEDEKHCLLLVQDQGIGMTVEQQRRITEPFYTTRRMDGGTGLGLSISTKIIEEHGGFLEFDSAPGRGTIARIVLPVDPEGIQA